MEGEKREAEEVVDKTDGVNSTQTNTWKKVISNGIQVTYANIDGFLSKRLEFMDYLRNSEPDIMCVVETKLRPEIKLDWFDVRQYKLWRNDRKNKGGGGIMVFTKKDLIVKEVNFSKGNEEVISMLITDGKQDINIVTVYIPPKTSAWNYEQYHEVMRNTLNRIKREITRKDRVVIVGDFNCKEIVWEDYEVVNGSEWAEELLNIATNNLMTQWVRSPTRCRGQDVAARLDLVFTKGISLKGELGHECPLGKSDHDVLRFKLDAEMNMEKSEEYREGKLNYVKANYSHIREFFNEIDWSVVYQEVDMQLKYGKFLDLYNCAVEKFVPYYRPRTLRNKQWFNGNCEEAKKNKEKAWKKFKKNRDVLSRDVYKTARNRYVDVRRTAQKEYEQRVVEHCDSDPKMFYKFINGRLNKREAIEKVKFEEEIYEDAGDIAEILNNNFCKVFTREEHFTGERPMEIKRMQDIVVTKEDVNKIVSNLDINKSMGPDGISGRLLKECKDQLLNPIFDIVQTSLQTGIVPKEWKRADIVPIYKNGSKMEPLNYRPVSLTSILCKVCEEVIKAKWSEYLERENILSERQFGFRKGRSCVSNLLCFYSRVTDILQHREGWVDAIYLDLRKAFDKVPHNRLMWKLKKIGGVSDKLARWMENYLMGREMRTVVKGKKSEWKKVTSGVPQGSVLGPIMFLIYVNDMPVGIDSYMNMFADDTKIMRRVKNMEDCNKLQEDLDRIYEWSKEWQMEFNISKSHVMKMGRSRYRPNKDYKLGGEKLEETNEEKDLGVIVQNTLSPEKHINKIFGKTYNMLQNIDFAFHYLDEEMMKKILCTLIRPQIEYAACIWSPHMKKHMQKVERVQRLATRMIPGFKELDYEERLGKLGLTTLEERRTRGDMITMYKLVNKIDILDRILVKVTTSNHLRGHGKKLMKDICLNDVRKYSFPHRSIDKWNKLSNDVVDAACVNQMKERYDRSGQGDRTQRA